MRGVMVDCRCIKLEILGELVSFAGVSTARLSHVFAALNDRDCRAFRLPLDLH